MSSKVNDVIRMAKSELSVVVARISKHSPNESAHLHFSLEDTIDALKDIRTGDDVAKPVEDEEPPKPIGSMMSSRSGKYNGNSGGGNCNFKMNSRCAEC